MGNNHTREGLNASTLDIEKLLNMKFKKDCKQNTHLKHEEFIIEYNKLTDYNLNTDEFDERRVVFVSLLGFYESWSQCPSFILYSSLLILPLKRKWIYNPIKYKDELESFSCFQKQDNNIFLRLLKWKDSQGFIFWMIDEYKYDQQNVIAPFWYDLSEKLCNLYDPVTRNNYNPINLDTKWYEINCAENTKYDVKVSSILCELFFVTMKYKTISEILYHSNPESFNLLTRYQSYHPEEIKKQQTKLTNVVMENGENNNGEWWISPEYFDD